MCSALYRHRKKSEKVLDLCFLGNSIIRKREGFPTCWSINGKNNTKIYVEETPKSDILHQKEKLSELFYFGFLRQKWSLKNLCSFSALQ